MPLDGLKTLAISIAGLLTMIGGMFNVPYLNEVANFLTANAEIVLTSLFALYGVLRTVTKSKAAISLVE